MAVSAAVDILILAAGAARRFGCCKLLESWQGLTLLEHVVLKALALPVDSVNLVTGAYAADMQQVLAQNNVLGRCRVLRFDDWAAGMGASLAFGIAQLSREHSVLVLLADQPLVDVVDLQKLLKKGQQYPHKIICAEFAGTLGVPALFPAAYKSELTQLAGDRGAKSVLLQHTAQVVPVSIAAAAIDIDCPADFALLSNNAFFK